MTSFKRLINNPSRYSSKIIYKTLRALPEEFTFPQARRQIQKLHGGLCIIKESTCRNRLYYMLKLGVIKSTPHPQDGRRVIYKKVNPLDK